MNGRNWQEKQLTGIEEIRVVLKNRGLSRISEDPNAPVFHEEEVEIIGDRITFYFRPDRVSSNGRPYYPYKVEMVFEGCKIRSLMVVEYIS